MSIVKEVSLEIEINEVQMEISLERDLERSLMISRDHERSQATYYRDLGQLERSQVSSSISVWIEDEIDLTFGRRLHLESYLSQLTQELREMQQVNQDLWTY